MTFWPGQQKPSTPSSEYNADRFHILNVLNRVSTATLVKVDKVSNKGEVKEVGTVDVTPLVNLQDGNSKQYKHAMAYKLPYFRVQGGDKAIIMDPKVGDIGVAVFADRDISTVVKTKKQGPAGSRRRFSMADGMFFPCFLGGKPKCYIDFTDDNKIVFSPDEGSTVVTIEAGKVHIKVGSTESQFQSGRVDLGQVPAPLGVMLDGLVVSTVVFGKP